MPLLLGLPGPETMTQEEMNSELYNDSNGWVHKFKEWREKFNNNNIDKEQQSQCISEYYRANDLFNELARRVKHTYTREQMKEILEHQLQVSETAKKINDKET
jgi:hypothetical protein